MQKITVVKLGMSALLSVMLAACSSTGTETTEEDVDTSAIQNTEASTRPAETTPQLSPAELAEQEREREALAMTVFYFDFDQSELKPEAREALVYHANQLRANPSMTVRLEGHADERGTREYNLALGERRAQAVQRYLEVQGVNGNQLEVISYGEERPAQNGTSEAAYAQNRRVEMVYN